MTLLLLILLGMVVILAAAWLKPDWFKNVYETYLKDAWIIAVGFVAEVYQWLQTDPTWQQIVDPKYLPYGIIGMGVLGILLRRINSRGSA